MVNFGKNLKFGVITQRASTYWKYNNIYFLM